MQGMMQPGDIARRADKRPYVPPKKFAPKDIIAGLVWLGLVVLGMLRMVSYLVSR